MEHKYLPLLIAQKKDKQIAYQIVLTLAILTQKPEPNTYKEYQ